MTESFPATSLFRFGRVILLVATALSFSAMASADSRLEKSVELVDALVGDIMTVVGSDPTPAKVRMETERIIDTYFDYDIIARFAAGNAWRSATDAEKTAYLKAFREILLSLAETQFDYFNSLEYASRGATEKGSKLVVVHGEIRDKTGELPNTNVSWRIRTRPDQPPRIIDIEVENISMLITQQQENTAIINSNGGAFQALIDSLNTQAMEIRAAAASTPN
ncbi:phospholipid-binding protein MlaC [Alphaproteobacteria bacterium LSUCC0684]